MGEVYQATHRLLQRQVAIKIVRPETLIDIQDDEIFLTLRRFQREARVSASLHSPHAVELYDFGMTADGTLYIVMELLTGLDLEQLVDRFGPLPPERACHFLQQAMSALQEMHGLGLVHRDIKPANLHVSRDAPHPDFLKVTDLGLVKPPRGATAEHRVMHAKGRILGTPAYIAPETVVGEPGDTRTDIYSLGCVAYWLLTGCTVFEAHSVQQMVWLHVQNEPVPPSQRTEIPVPLALEQLVLSCLEKDPRRRPQSVEQLSDRLAECELPRAWTHEHAKWWWRMHAPAGQTALAV
jgi:serine/threonine-protein kinase